MEKKYWSHKSTEIEKKAKIGQGTKIWHNCQILSGAQIGKNCIIGHNCFVSSRAELGNNVKLESNIDVWDLIILKDFVFIGPSAVFTNDINPRAKYSKKKNPHYGKWISTIVKEGATVGANATIVCGVSRRIIGKWAMIGAGAVVSKNVSDYTIVKGNPAEVTGWVCECGKKIEFINNKTFCKICKRKYLKNKEKVKQIKK